MLKSFVSAVVGALIFVSAAKAQTCSAPMNNTPADAMLLNNYLNCKFAPLTAPSFTGNVGIGTLTTSFPLEVVGLATEKMAVNSVSGSVSGVGGSIQLSRPDDGVYVGGMVGGKAPNDPYLIYTAGGGSDLRLASLGGSASGISFYTNDTLANVVASTPPASLKVIITGAGYVGIGTSAPTYPLYVNGTAYAMGAAGALSDRRHKKNIEAFDSNALDLIAQLKPVTFYWKEPKDDGMKGRQIGFIAQDVQTVIPDIVLTANNAEKTLGLKYDSLIPVLTKAIQQQQAQIKSLKSANDNQAAQVAKQANEIAELQAQMRKLQRTARAGMPEADTHKRRMAFAASSHG